MWRLPSQSLSPSVGNLAQERWGSGSASHANTSRAQARHATATPSAQGPIVADPSTRHGVRRRFGFAGRCLQPKFGREDDCHVQKLGQVPVCRPHVPPDGALCVDVGVCHTSSRRLIVPACEVVFALLDLCGSVKEAIDHAHWDALGKTPRKGVYTA
jgi:hypothetical protein